MANPPHLRYPLHLGADGSFDSVEQDTLDDVVQCVRIVSTTPVGTRVELPLFGVPRVEFQQPVALVTFLTALYTWEPRASLLVRAAYGTRDPLEFDIQLNAGT